MRTLIESCRVQDVRGAAARAVVEAGRVELNLHGVFVVLVWKKVCGNKEI